MATISKVAAAMAIAMLCASAGAYQRTRDDSGGGGGPNSPAADHARAQNGARVAEIADRARAQQEAQKNAPQYDSLGRRAAEGR